MYWIFAHTSSGYLTPLHSTLPRHSIIPCHFYSVATICQGYPIIGSLLVQNSAGVQQNAPRSKKITDYPAMFAHAPVPLSSKKTLRCFARRISAFSIQSASGFGNRHSIFTFSHFLIICNYHLIIFFHLLSINPSKNSSNCP